MTWPPGTRGEFPKFLTDVTLGEVLFQVSATSATLFFATFFATLFFVTLFATFSPTTVPLSPTSTPRRLGDIGLSPASWQGRPLNVSSNLATTNEGCRERLLCNKHNQHAILARTVCLLQSQRERSDGDVMLQQRNNPNREYFIKLLCNQIVISGCQHEHKTSDICI